MDPVRTDCQLQNAEIVSATDPGPGRLLVDILGSLGVVDIISRSVGDGSSFGNSVVLFISLGIVDVISCSIGNRSRSLAAS